MVQPSARGIWICELDFYFFQFSSVPRQQTDGDGGGDGGGGGGDDGNNGVDGMDFM